VAIVTGGGSGYGEGIAHTFGAQGAQVIIADINDEGGKRVAATLPSNLTFFHTNVAKEDDWKALIEFTVQKFGKIDILVNNAGTSYKNKPTLEVTEEEFDRVFLVNVKSIFFSIAAIIPQLLSQNTTASIINIASTGATRPRPGLVWYNASKGAVQNATKGLASEYGKHGIRINSICPLLGATGLFTMFTGMEDSPENRAKFLGNVPMGRLCTPDDVANACLFLASDDSQFVTGTSLEVDGGRCIG